MKRLEVLINTYKTFQGDEDDALLRLAFLKERGDYRAFFAENIGKLKDAHFRPHFHEEMFRRFGILPSGYAGRPVEEWSSFFDPMTDARETPEAVRRYILPNLFYWPGVREVVTVPPQVVVWPLIGQGECPRVTDSPECAPYERLYKIDLRKKTSVLLDEFKAALAAVDVRRELNPATYEAWEQDRSRKRDTGWRNLKVWQMRRQIPMPSFQEIGRELEITPEAAKKGFYRAYEMIYGEPYDREEWLKHRTTAPRTCKECPQRDSCIDADACPALFDEKKSTDEYIPGDAELNETLEGKTGSRADAYAYQEWLNREEKDES